MPNTVRLHRFLTTKPERVYRAFIEADALAKSAELTSAAEAKDSSLSLRTPAAARTGGSAPRAAARI